MRVRLRKTKAEQMLVNDGIEFYMAQVGPVLTPMGIRLERIGTKMFLYQGEEITEAKAKKILRQQLSRKFEEVCAGAMTRGWMVVSLLQSKKKMRVIRESAMNRPAFYVSN